jgi:hypothetical protein
MVWYELRVEWIRPTHRVIRKRGPKWLRNHQGAGSHGRLEAPAGMSFTR